MSAGVAGSRSDRILLALVAVFVPSRAPALLSRLGGPEAAPLLAAGIHLASLPRRERLHALAAALDELTPSRALLPASLAAAERPLTRERLARARSAGGDGGGNPPRPALTRLLEEEALGAREAADGPPCAPGASR